MTTPRPDLSGLWVPIITPFDSTGSLDLVSLERLAKHLLGEGAAGLVALGTTGEPATLDETEQRAVVDVCDSVCRTAGRRLMIGTGSIATQHTVEETQRLTEGTIATAALVVVPYYVRPSEEAIVDHFHLVADESPVPIVAYNVPYRTGRGLGARAILEMASHPNIVGIKQSIAMLDVSTLEVLRDRPDDFAVMSGDDAFVAPTILMGGVGAISAAAHVCTAAFAEMAAAAAAGRAARAAALTAQLLGVVTTGFAEPSPAVWKGALAAQGWIASPLVRRPLQPAGDESVRQLLQAIELDTAPALASTQNAAR